MEVRKKAHRAEAQGGSCEPLSPRISFSPSAASVEVCEEVRKKKEAQGVRVSPLSPRICFSPSAAGAGKTPAALPSADAGYLRGGAAINPSLDTARSTPY